MDCDHIKFRVYPGRRGQISPAPKQYWNVYAYDSKIGMFEHADRHPSIGDKSRNYLAVTLPIVKAVKRGRRWVGMPHIGDVVFCKQRIGSTTISHEAVHMATHFLRCFNKLKLGDEIDESEELLAYAISSCVVQLVNNFYSQGMHVNQMRDPDSKIVRSRISSRIRKLAGKTGTVVLAGGCFGMVHPGHCDYLRRAAALGDVLVVAVNSDASYLVVKGRPPAIPWEHRAMAVASLECVDLVIALSEPTPHHLLRMIKPHVLVKSNSSEMPPIGHEIVESYGGKIVVVEAFGGYSTSELLRA